MQIGDKMFTYIQNHEYLNSHPEIVSEYKNSMIFIGDQQQIYVPVINSYVGLGKDAYTYLLNKLDNNTDDFNVLYDVLKHDTVTSLYAQYSVEDLARTSTSTTINSPLGNDYTIPNGGDSLYTQTANQILQAKRNVVVRGAWNDENLDVNDRVLNSGINVTIKHQGNNYVTGTAIDSNGNQYTYSYYNPEHDIILIDDTNTWAYINTQSSYIIKFAYEFATAQANRVYHNIIGEPVDIYVEKEFHEAFIKDGNNLTFIQPVYVKLKDNSADEGYRYYEVTRDGNYLVANGNNIWDLVNNEIPNGTNIAIFAEGGTQSYNDPNQSILIYEPVWYQKDSAITGSHNTNIADGIQTIKEVAYILDIITDGDNDDAIQIAYNVAYNYVEIQKIKDWQSKIGDAAVQSFESTSNNQLITVDSFNTNSSSNETAGNIHLAVDLVLAQTYTGADGSSYAAYLAIDDHKLPNYSEYFKEIDDITYNGNYYLIGTSLSNTSSSLYQLLLEYYGNNLSSQLFKVYNTTDNDNNTIPAATATISNLVSNVNNLEEKYLYFPYHRVFDSSVTTNQLVTKGLTTVEWVTTYVHWLSEDINTRINAINVTGDIGTYIQTYLNTPSTGNINDPSDPYHLYTDETSKGLFVSRVYEEAGVITVEKQKLPLDTILSNHVYTTDHSIYIPITFEEAVAKFSQENIYVYDNTSGTYQKVNQAPTQSGANYKLKIDDITSFSSIAAAEPINNLIENLGNTSYFYKVSANGVDQYIPLDVQTSYTNTNYFTSDGKVAANDTIYYLNTTNSTVFNNYIRTSVFQKTDGSTATSVSAYISYLAASSETKTGLADAWDVRRTIESMFAWIDLSTNKLVSGQ